MQGSPRLKQILQKESQLWEKHRACLDGERRGKLHQDSIGSVSPRDTLENNPVYPDLIQGYTKELCRRQAIHPTRMMAGPGIAEKS